MCWCCLGVACEVYRKATGNGQWLQDSYSYVFSVGADMSRTALPEAVCKWLGLESTAADPILLANVSCVIANDKLEWTYAQIADALEAKYINEQETGK